MKSAPRATSKFFSCLPASPHDGAGVGFSVRRGESIARERGIRLTDD